MGRNGVTKIFIEEEGDGGAPESKDWHVVRLGNSPQVRALVMDAEKVQIAGGDAHACIPDAATKALIFRRKVRIDLRQITTHGEPADDPLPLRASRLAFRLKNSEGSIDDPNLTVVPRRVWETAKTAVKGRRD